MGVTEKVKRQMAEGSLIRKMFEEGIALKKQFGADKVFDLSLGNPMMEPPAEFYSVLRRLADNPIPGMHRYMVNQGYTETRAAVAEHLKKETGLPFTASEILMTAGAAGALNIVLKAILDPGDEVIVFTPYFVDYLYYIDNFGGIPKILPTDANFLPDMKVLAQNINAKTKAILINTPNNPSGAVYGSTLFEKIGKLLAEKEKEFKHDIFLLSDEPYRKIVFDGAECPYTFKYHAHSVMCTSHSKDLALPGERIGYVAVNPGYSERAEFMVGLISCARVLGFINAPALMQNIVRYLQDSSVDVEEYQRKRDFYYNNLTEIGYSVFKPHGTFYIFPRSPIPDDVAFTKALAKHNVLTVPGAGFGTPGYFRIAYCYEDRVLEGSLPGLRAAAKEFGLKK